MNARSSLATPGWLKVALIGGALGYIVLVLLLPLAAVFVEALREGWPAYVAALEEPDAVSAIKLTLWVAAISVPLNMIFGIAISVIVAAIIALIAHIALTRSRPGWHILAVGGSRRSAHNAGIKVRQTVFMTYVISGICCGIGCRVRVDRLHRGCQDGQRFGHSRVNQCGCCSWRGWARRLSADGPAGPGSG